MKYNIESFNYFVDVEMTKIVREIGEASPRILPRNLESLKFKFERVWVGKADYFEKEGISRVIYPHEALIRNLTYSGPVYLEFSVYENGEFKNKYVVNIGRLPIMVKSKLCNTYGLSEEELIAIGEDPRDPGGYFIINGTERVVVMSEDLLTNKLYVQEEKDPVKVKGWLMSESLTVSHKHSVELMNDGTIYISFERYKRIPAVVLMKALGLEKDSEIAQYINEDNEFEEVYLNLIEYGDIKTEKDAALWLANKLKLTGTDDVKIEKLYGILDTKLLPHLGTDSSSRRFKAYNIAKMVRKILLFAHGYIDEDIKDHWMNKVVRSVGDLMKELFRHAMLNLINDAMYQYERFLKRGKIQNYNYIFRAKIFTERIESAMSTGTWNKRRTGVSQALDRTNLLSVLSYITRVTFTIQKNIRLMEARMVHGTHWGRLDLIETPESRNTGLRKNLAIMSRVSYEEIDMESLINDLKKIGLEDIRYKNVSSDNRE